VNAEVVHLSSRDPRDLSDLLGTPAEETARAAASGPDPNRSVSAWRALGRGLLKRCPRCGSAGLFTGWFTMSTECPRCGLRLMAEQGGFLGAMTLNWGFAIGVWAVVLVMWLALTLPDTQMVPLLIASLGIAGVLPLVFYPTSKSIWAAVEFLVHRSDPDYFAGEDARRVWTEGDEL
jgi:uncharacterized protein (DUF983 family)